MLLNIPQYLDVSQCNKDHNSYEFPLCIICLFGTHACSVFILRKRIGLINNTWPHPPMTHAFGLAFKLVTSIPVCHNQFILKEKSQK